MVSATSRVFARSTRRVVEGLGRDGLDGRVDRLLERFERDALARHGVDREAGVVDRGAHVPGAGVHGDAALHHELAVEVGGRAAAEHLGEELERLRIAPLRGARGRRQVEALQGRLLDLRVGDLDVAGGARIGLARPPPDRALAERRDAAVGGVGDAAHLVRLDVAGDDQDRVLGRVETPVVGERVVAIEALDLVHPADDRRAVGVAHEQRRRHRLRKLGRRIGLDPHAALLEHDVALGRDHRLVEDEAGHAVGLELHHGPEVLAGDALEIGRVVVGGEGVLLAAERRDDLAELARRVLGSCP